MTLKSDLPFENFNLGCYLLMFATWQAPCLLTTLILNLYVLLDKKYKVLPFMFSVLLIVRLVKFTKLYNVFTLFKQLADNFNRKTKHFLKVF